MDRDIRREGEGRVGTGEHGGTGTGGKRRLVVGGPGGHGK